MENSSNVGEKSCLNISVGYARNKLWKICPQPCGQLPIKNAIFNLHGKTPSIYTPSKNGVFVLDGESLTNKDGVGLIRLANAIGPHNPITACKCGECGKLIHKFCG